MDSPEPELKDALRADSPEPVFKYILKMIVSIGLEL